MEERLDRIHHVTLAVSDLDRAIEWYTTSFACTLLERDRLFAVLQFENILLILTLPSLQPTHLCYLKADAASYGELRERATGMVSTFVSDPLGNPVELAETAIPFTRPAERDSEQERR